MKDIPWKVIVRWSATTILGAPIGIVIAANVEKLAQDRKWDIILTNMWPTVVDLSKLLESGWFWFAFGALVATSILLWGERWRWWAFYSAKTTEFTERKLSHIQETIDQRTYTNESVEIDGRLFNKCRFNNATLIYRGIGQVTIIESRFSGTTFVRSNDPAIIVFDKLKEGLRAHPDATEFRIGEMDPSGNIRFTSELPTKNRPDGSK